MNDVEMPDSQLAEISRRLARLDRDKQVAFLKKFAASGVNLAMLPIIRQGLQRSALSFAQSRLWFLWRMDPSGTGYTIANAQRIRGSLDHEALDRGFEFLLRRHEALRTVFRQQADGAEQIILEAPAFQVRRVVPEEQDREAAAMDWARRDAATPFDLENGPLIRVTLLTLGEQDHLLLVTLHHIVADGWSMSLLSEEFWRTYDAFAEGRTPALPELAIQYTDYAAFQHLWMEAMEGERQLAYWTGKLGTDEVTLDLPLDHARPALPNPAGARIHLLLEPELTTALRALARQQETTLFAVLLAALKAVLLRHTGQGDIRIGVPVAGRNREETRPLIGLFTNMQVLRTALRGEDRLADLLARVTETVFEAQDHQDLPFEHLVEALQPQRSLSQSPLFQVLYNHLRRGQAAPPARTGLTLEKIETGVPQANFDLALDTEETQADGIAATFTYPTALFDRATIERLAAHWAIILRAMVSDPAQRLRDVALLSAEEQDRLRLWNHPVDADPAPCLVHEAVARHAQATPAAPAIVFGDTVLSYGELDARASRLAHRLIRFGVTPETMVGVAARRSPALIVGLLAVLKAGGTYVPLDPEHPPARLAHATDDAGMRLLLTDSATITRLPARPGLQVLALDALDLSGEPADDPGIALHPGNLAYMIYTSGSTGTPKGVAVAHGPFAMHCRATAALYDMDHRSRELHFLSFAFDGAHERLWTALSIGAALVMRDDDLWSPERTLQEIAAQRVTNAGFPPAYLQQLADFAAWQGSAPPVDLYSFGGEAMPRAGFDKVKAALRPRALINGYGPTETVVTPLVWKTDADTRFEATYAPIGRPVGDRTAVILDGDLNLVPPGVVGELYIGGSGLARGYHGRAGLTAERFVPDAYGEVPGGRLYRTGDLARWRPDGVVEYLGRVDDQVKIRGFRIELGEIEARLLGEAGVREAVVVAQAGTSGQPQLVGYVTGAADGVALRAALSGVLPDYMVPSQVLVLDRLPLTPNGKIDRKGLPQPQWQVAEHVAPRSEAEQVLAGIWRGLLRIEQVGLGDNFFELGGDSIISLQMVSRARQAGWVIEPKEVFRHQTLQALAAVARPAAQTKATAPKLAGPAEPDQALLDELGLDAAQVEDIYPLSPMQQGMLFHSLQDAGSGVYVNQLSVEIAGLDGGKLRAAWQLVSDRHPILRTALQWRDLPDAARQVVYRQVDVSFIEEDWRGRAIDAAALRDAAEAERIGGFDLSQPPLQRVRLIRLDDDRHQLIWTHHHILLDGWSSARLMGEILSAYHDRPLPPAPAPYRDYIAWLQGRDQAAAEAFWREQARALDTPTRLAEAFGPPHATGQGRATFDLRLEAEQAERLQVFARRERITLNTLIQAAWALVLRRCTGSATVSFGSTVAGRPTDLAGAETMLGLFINTLPVVVRLQPAMAVGDWLRGLQEQNLALREHEHTPLNEIQRWAGYPGQPLFDTLVIFENYPVERALRMPGDLRFGLAERVAPTNYAFVIVASATAEQIDLACTYDADRVSAGDAAKLQEMLRRILEALAADASRLVDALPLLSGAEADALVGWGGVAASDAVSGTVVAAIAARAAAQPDAEALVFGSEGLSYAALEGRANRLAWRLRDQGVGPDVVVGLAVERSIAMVVGLLAILKAGGAWLPLDPDYPPERLAMMMRDAGLSLVLTQRHLRDGLPAGAARLLCLDEGAAAGTAADPGPPPVVLHASHLAYMIYTSGSTGTPKGVGVSHGALLRRLRWMQAEYGIAASETLLHKTPFSFDVSVWELLLPLLAGARLAIAAPGVHGDPRRLIEAIRAHDVTTLHFIPPVLELLIAEPEVAECRSLRRLFSGGEALSGELRGRVQALLPWVRFDNRYGPTEATINASVWTCGAADAGAVPIGHPIPGTILRVLDGDLNLVPPGVVGELYIGGSGLARGYHGRAGLTAERFVPDAYGDAPGGRLYRTGDLARWRSDGVVEYLGRVDDQVKIRGFRIELGEIEARLLGEAGVREAVVVAQAGTSGQPQLVGYVTGAADGVALRAALSGVLPDYMVPAQVLVLDRLPLTPNGKIDRKGLPQPQWQVAEHVAPRSEAEQALAGIWRGLLRIEQVGLGDNFFELGGDSIISLQMVSRARQAGWVIEPKEVFRHQTLQALAAVARPAAQTKATAPKLAGPAEPDQALLDELGLDAAQVEDIYPLSPMQQGMLFHSLQDAGSGVYVNQLSAEITGLDGGRLRAAWQLVSDRHPILRTGFLWQGLSGGARQVVHRRIEVPFAEEDWRGRPVDAAALRAAAEAERVAGFDLSQPPLQRVRLIQIDDIRHQLIWTRHHILTDGWSSARLMGEILSAYHDRPLPPAPAPYRDYIAWLQGRDQAASERFWREQLSRLSAPTLVAAAVLPARREAGHMTLPLRLAPGLVGQLQAFAGRERITLNTLIQAAWALLLQRYTGEAVVSFGSTVAGRPADLPGAEEMLGLFINTLPVVVRPQPAMAVGDWLRGLQEQNLALREHEHTPLNEIQRWAGYPGQPLFDSNIVFENYPIDRAMQQPGAALRVVAASSHVETSYPLTLTVVPNADAIEIAYRYRRDALDQALITQMHRQLGHGLEALARDGERRLDDAALASLVAEAPEAVWVETLHLAARSVLPLILAAAARQPAAAAAVVDGAGETSHGALASRSNRLAHALTSRGIGAEARIGICADRNAGFVTALLGVLKAGAAYVPLDPTWPAARLRQVAADAGLALVLADGAGVAALQEAGIAATALAEPALLAGQPEGPPAVDPHPGQTAYVIYTSGSTGQPKGVAVSHGALANYVQAMLERLQPPAGAMAMVSTPAADLGHTVLFGALASGATLHLLDAATTGDAEAFARRMREGGVDVLKIVPSHLRGLLQAHEGADVLPRGLLILGGEACDPALVAEVRRRRPECRIVNHYGPTETTVGVLTHEVVAAPEGVIPVGRPLPNLRAHVLDAGLNAVPAGVAGELYLGGAQLARGYLGQPGLTAERFVPDAYGEAGGRLYRTGDRVVRGGDGLIRFLGRVDEQVKIRGYRVEPGEVARVMRQQPGILDAVVLARAVQPEDRLQLVAYCVGEAGAPLQVEALRAQLAAILPDYMVPAQIMLLERLPLTPNGKVDRKALPAPEQGGTAALALPQGPVEETLAEVWREVLRIDRVGRADNFFELGGDSILSLQVIARLRKRGLQLTPKQIFEKQTIQQLAAVAVAVRKKGPSPASGEHRLLPIQQRFFAEVAEDRHHWNQAVLLRPRVRLEWDRVEAALLAVMGQHEALRLRFREGSAGWMAEPGPAPEGSALLWRREAADEAGVTALCEVAQRSLDLASGPLLRAVGFDLADGSQRLLVVIHHLVVDGVSWRVLLEDLQAGYGGQALPARTESYAQWSARLQGLAGGLEGELGWWRQQQVAGDLPCDRMPEGADCVGDAEVVSLELDAGVTRALLREAPAAYRTQVNDLLLAALARSVGAWSGQDAVLVELEGHGREDVFAGADVSRTVGWFTTAYPVLLPVAGETGAQIRQVKERLRSVPQRGLGYGVLRYLGTSEQRAALSGQAGPRITFNYLGQFDGSFGEAALLAPAAESAGAARSAKAPLGRWLTINGRVYEGRLRLGWSYSRRRHDRATVERLAEGFGAALREIVAHCGSAPLGLTPSDVPLSGLDQQQLDSLELDPGQVEEIYPLSPMQQGMLFHSLQDAGSGVYVNQLSVEIGGLDGGRLRAAWQAVSDRHAILRTGFVWQGLPGGAQQVVHRRVAVPFVEADWRGRATDAAALQAVAEAERAAGFDLAQPPLQRVLLIRLDDDRHQLIWTRHHILTDGWSSARLIGEILSAYHGQPLPAAPAGYRDYIAWLQTRDRKAAEQFWRGQLRDLDAPTLLASSLGSAPAGEGHAMCHTRLDEAETERLQAFARRERITLNTLIQGAWALLLRRHTGQEAVSFGATVAGRPAALPGVEETVGLFINTLPVVLRPQPSATVGDWLRAVQAQNLALREFEETPLYEIQGWAGYAGQPLFDSIIVFENYPADRGLQQRAERPLRFANLTTIDVTNYPMDLSVLVDTTLVVEYTYMLSHFSAAQAEQIREQFEHLLRCLASDAGRSLGDIRPETARDRAAIARCNAGAVACASRPLVHEAIAAHARRDPDSIALIIGETALTYAALDAEANRLANHLIAQGVGPDGLVGVIVHRTAATMIALLAVLKAGGAYVPLDPEYPTDRLSFIIRDAGIFLLLGEPPADLDIPLGIRVVDHTRLDLAGTAATAPRPMLADQHLAYLIYTSGSTGQPKGVAVTHGPLAMHCIATGTLYEIDESACEAHFLSLAFDGAHERWLTVLTHGARLVMRDAALWTPEQTCAVLHRHRATHIGLPPAYLQQLAEWVERSGNPPPVKLYSFGGEAMPQAGFDRVRRVLAPQILINGYGPTETVVTPLVWKVDAATDCAAAYAPIGMPVGDRQAYILDADLNLVPAGVAGELYIGGSGLARGYHGRPGLTAERFVPDPFAAVPGGRLYRTGDLVRCGVDGNIEYLGRLDDQVKIRGYRIELGEVQSRLLAHPAIRQATVIAAAAPEGSRLIGYVTPLVPGVDADRLAETVTADLKRELPDYMIPARIMVLAAMPMMPNGKVDRYALPEPAWGSEDHVPPATEAEARMAAIWADVLELERVGVTDNFFELGGNSLLSLRVIGRLRQEPALGVEIKLRDLMRKPTIRALLAGAGTGDRPMARLRLNAAVPDAPPVFCLHGGLGTVFDYIPLARRLEGRRQVIGLQSRMLVDRRWTDASLAAMAADYAQEIRQIQPAGPYYLLGWSLGGMLAALTAAALEREGEQVALLALVDSTLPNTIEASRPDWLEALRALLAPRLPEASRPRLETAILKAREAGRPESEMAVEGIMTAVLDALPPDAARSSPEIFGGGQGAGDLARAFIIGRHLRDLAAAAGPWPALRAKPHCWWTGRRGEAWPHHLPDVHDEGAVGDDHFAILRDPLWLDAICGILLAEAMAGQEMDPAE